MHLCVHPGSTTISSPSVGSVLKSHSGDIIVSLFIGHTNCTMTRARTPRCLPRSMLAAYHSYSSTGHIRQERWTRLDFLFALEWFVH